MAVGISDLTVLAELIFGVPAAIWGAFLGFIGFAAGTVLTVEEI